MSEHPDKRKCREAKALAMQEYIENGFAVYASDNAVICFTAKDKARTHEDLVRVVIGEIVTRDMELIRSVPAFPVQRKVIMCRRNKRWIRRIYDHTNLLCQ